jgi:hypothetical protein
MNKEQTITKLEEIIYTYENKTESNKLSEFAEGRLSAFRFSLNLIKNIKFIRCCESDSELLCDEGKLSFDFDGTEYISRKVGKKRYVSIIVYNYL